MVVTSITRLTREIKELARDKGADLVGIAPVSRFQEAPENRYPRFYIPQAQTCSGGSHASAPEYLTQRSSREGSLYIPRLCIENH